MSVNLSVPGAATGNFQRTYEHARDVPPATPAPPDDEWEQVGIDLTKWTLDNCVEGTIDPLTVPAQNTIEQPGNGFLYLQGDMTSGSFGLRQDYEVPFGRSIIVKAHIGGNLQVGPVDNGLGMFSGGLNNADAGVTAGISYRVSFFEPDGTDVDIQLDGAWGNHERRVGSATGVDNGKGFCGLGSSWYRRHTVRSASGGTAARTYHHHSLSGVAWSAWEKSSTPLATRPNNIWIRSNNGPVAGRTVAPILVIEFCREGDDNFPVNYGP